MPCFGISPVLLLSNISSTNFMYSVKNKQFLHVLNPLRVTAIHVQQRKQTRSGHDPTCTSATKRLKTLEKLWKLFEQTFRDFSKHSYCATALRLPPELIFHFALLQLPLQFFLVFQLYLVYCCVPALFMLYNLRSHACFNLRALERVISISFLTTKSVITRCSRMALP